VPTPPPLPGRFRRGLSNPVRTGAKRACGRLEAVFVGR
jgi:hypothetical protein